MLIENVEYLRDLAHELAELARSEELGVLALLFQMAEIEAKGVVGEGGRPNHTLS
jgi:hypothetical protein